MATAFNAALLDQVGQVDQVDQVDPGGAMEQDQGWLAELQVRPRVVALLRILSPSSQISITLVTLRPLHLDQQVLTFCSPAPPPCLLRASCPACSTEASHSRTSLDPLSYLPTSSPLSAAIMKRLWQAAPGPGGWPSSTGSYLDSLRLP